MNELEKQLAELSKECSLRSGLPTYRLFNNRRQSVLRQIESLRTLSIERVAITVISIEHIEVRFGNKTAHVSRHKTDDCEFEICFDSVQHHAGSDLASITDAEKEMIRAALASWEPIAILVRLPKRGPISV